MTPSDHIFQSAQRSHEELPDDPPNYLADKPRGKCPYCQNYLMDHEKTNADGDFDSWRSCGCGKWHSGDTEDANRARYAAEREAEAKLEDRLAREARKYGREE